MKLYRNTINFLSEFSIPLIVGVVLALIFANLDHENYEHLIHYPLFGENFRIAGHLVNFHFLANDIFMVLFFGIASVEIVQALLPGGSLNPASRAVNPLFGTLGGVFGPAGVYLLLCSILNVDEKVYHGWGIPTATDIALAWLAARFIFGSKHPAVSFLLLLAVADDAIGLGIIAVFYSDPELPVELPWLLLILLGMVVSFSLRRKGVSSFWAYIIGGGIPAWFGLLLAHLHPALALVAVVPFMPTKEKQEHKALFEDELENSTLVNFEHFFKLPVDFGLFAFGFANAGVPFSEISEVTWIVFFALLGGKVVGIVGFSMIAHWIGMKLPKGMTSADLITASMIAAIGLTVALFVAGEAFVDAQIQGAAKMGALFSAFIVVPAWIVSRLLGVVRHKGKD